MEKHKRKNRLWNKKVAEINIKKKSDQPQMRESLNEAITLVTEVFTLQGNMVLSSFHYSFLHGYSTCGVT